MANARTDTASLRERLTGLLADWGSEMSILVRELDDTRAELESLKARNDGRDAALEQLEDKLARQNELLDTLKADAEEASALRKEHGEKELQIERLSSEVESKQELVRALRRDAGSIDRLKSEGDRKDRTIAQLRADLREAEAAVADLRGELESWHESSENQSAEDRAELEGLRAELEARKSMIKSLRGDSERVTALEASLEEKREIVSSLEESINRHVETIAELKRSNELWKKKYQALKGGDGATTSVELPVFSDTDVAVMQDLDATDTPDHTVAINMRRPLSEARRKAAQGNGKT
jgi:chromosome segregation ATPase